MKKTSNWYNVGPLNFGFYNILKRLLNIRKEESLMCLFVCLFVGNGCKKNLA